MNHQFKAIDTKTRKAVQCSGFASTAEGSLYTYGPVKKKNLFNLIYLFKFSVIFFLCLFFFLLGGAADRI